MNQASLYSQVNKGQKENGDALIALTAPTAGQQGLDIGSGTGELSYELAQAILPGGHLTCIDPDQDRQKLAQANQPNDLTNIDWIEKNYLDQDFPANHFDFIFSNYVFHWFDEKQAAINAAYQQLKPGGRFAFCAVFAHPPCMVETLDYAVEAGKKVRAAIQFVPKETWLSYFEQAGFRVEVDDNVTPYYHENIDDFLLWLEATSHGMFNIRQLTTQQLYKLRDHYPGELYLHKDCTLRLVAYKD